MASKDAPDAEHMRSDVTEKTPLIQPPKEQRVRKISTVRRPPPSVRRGVNASSAEQPTRRLSTSAAVGVPESAAAATLRRNASYGTNLPRSWSNYCRPSPYTEENKPNRRPFHIPRVPTTSSFVSTDGETHDDLESNNAPEDNTTAGGVPSNSTDPHTLLYTRYRYYSRLRAPAQADDHALVIPDHIVPIHLFTPYIPGGQTLGPDGKQSSVITVISIWNTMMGTSILTMPWAFGMAGFGGGLLIMFIMAGVCLFTAVRLLTLQKVAGLDGGMLETSSLCREMIGGVWGRLLEGGSILFSVITLVGALIVYWVLMSNFLFNTGQVIHDAIYDNIPDVNSSTGVLCPFNETNVSDNFTASNFTVDDVTSSTFQMIWNLNYTCPIFLLIIFIPLLCIKNTRIFSYFNSLGAISVLAIYLFVIVKAASWGINIEFFDVESPFYVPLFKIEFMALTGTLSLAYFIHNCVITLMKLNRHQENNVRDLSIAYTMVLATYVPVALLFYVSFPLPKYCIADNFLNNFPSHAVVLAIVRVFLFFQMVTVYPLLCLFARTQLLCYFKGSSDPMSSPLLSFAINIVIMTTGILVAMFYPNVGFIIRWVGSFAGLVYIFLIPCGLHLKALYSKGNLTVLATLVYSLIMILGLANFVAQFFL